MPRRNAAGRLRRHFNLFGCVLFRRPKPLRPRAGSRQSPYLYLERIPLLPGCDFSVRPEDQSRSEIICTGRPTALDDSHQKKLDKLKNESGNDFSSDFSSMQVSAHKDAVSLFERYAKGGDNADLTNWAGKTLPTLKHHLDMAQKLDK
jgi:hypothetical protein